MSQINSDIRLTRLSASVRQPAVAGYFYPDDPAELRQMIHAFLAGSRRGVAAPKALIVPHAGYVYSGPVAASAYATLHSIKDKIRRVVLLGPAHRVYLQGMALSGATRFATPLGFIDIDSETVEKLKAFPWVQVMDAAHEQEHSLEVHLPFLQTILDYFTLVPLVVGDCPPEQVARVLASVWGDEETLIVISSDLSHYHDYATACRIDKNTGQLIRDKQFEAIGPHQACGCMPLDGLLKIARERNMNVEVLDLRNSGDTAGSRDRVVGYGAFAVYPAVLGAKKQGDVLLDTALESIDQGFHTGRPLSPNPDEYAAELRENRATFTTLTLNRALRGCIGGIEPTSALIISTAESAFNAAFRDPRFPALSRDEFQKIELSISVLTPKTAISFTCEEELLTQLVPGQDGLIIELGERRATFLPSVWESLPRPEDFLNHLKQKAGMSIEDVPQKAWRYHTQSYKRAVD